MSPGPASGRRLPALATAVVAALAVPATLLAAAPANARPVRQPASVTIAGDLQSALGCDDDWDPACAATGLALAADDGVWQATWTVPEGAWQYRAALDADPADTVGAHATPNGDAIELTLDEPTPVRFFFDHDTRWVTDSVTSTIVSAPGTFQSELGCTSDWDPACLRSWLQDPDGDGTYSFTTTGIPAGPHEAKVAIGQSWAENYGADGVRDGANIAFTVPSAGSSVAFDYDSRTHVLTIRVTPAAEVPTSGPDHDVEWDGLGHDSRSDLYRSPGGAVPAGTDVALRFRTFADDVTSVTARVWSVRDEAERLLPMSRAARGASCQREGLGGRTCDFWQVTVPGDRPDNLWYRFIVTDGADTDFHADDTPALDGGSGATTDDAVDHSWALMIHEPGFEAPAWASGAVIYQVFPDRFADGDPGNNPQTGDRRYADPVLQLPWGTLPEGFCRNHTGAATNCGWRFDDDPPATSPDIEAARGRDYMGGDLQGLSQRLDDLAALGVNTIYLNPIFDSGSNHGYDTQDYHRIEPAFGSRQTWDDLVRRADERGIRLVVDGVFNHLSSDSPFFDRYGHFDAVGACESLDSPFRAWFRFTPQQGGPCVGPGGPHTMAYVSWAGFDSIPELDKANPEVQAYFLTDADSVTRRWLQAGASGWRLDVSGDVSFPDGYWESFREVVQATDPDALTISETWQKDSILLRSLRGDRLDTTMNYRLRDAVLGLLVPGPFDPKGFPDAGRVLAPSEFAARILSVREDYPDAAYFSLMNLLDSHDTERLLWTLTPGAETVAARELDAANVADGKARQRVAALIQFTMPGAPTVYYGDEVAMTGDDDPDDRRTYPWPETTGGVDTRDLDMLAHYTALARARADTGALTTGDLRVLLADDAASTVAYGRGTPSQAAVVVVNRGGEQAVTVPVAGWLPEGTALGVVASANASPGAESVTVQDAALRLTLPAMSAVVLATDIVDLAPPPAPANLAVTAEGDGRVSLSWDAAPDAAGHHVYASPVSGGGFTRVTATRVAGTSHTVAGLPNATQHLVVTALDEHGNESPRSAEVTATPGERVGGLDVRGRLDALWGKSA